MAKKIISSKEDLSLIEVSSIISRVSDEQLRLKKLHFAHAMTPLENPMIIRAVRKDIARLQTELSKRK